jgi:hypothetical protein
LRFIWFRCWFRFFWSSGVELIGGFFKSAGNGKLNSIGGSCKRVFDEFSFGRRKGAKNMAHQLLSVHAIDAQFQSRKTVAREMSQEGTNPVVAAVPPVHTKAEVTQREGNIIEDHENLLGLPAEEAGQRADGAATFVHVGKRLDQKDIVNFACPGFPLVFKMELLPRPPGESIEHPKTDIMAGVEIFVPGIPESNDAFEAHARKLTAEGT